ncbi:LamG-like jellyroll fold domain-containing protein [Flavobacterium sp. 20NA77.7]|uniref:LamG-like jellyroll fold domain-containing protein n=1 Tax=Flavobacterium nakdongensis TaxID=3073563 RepID=A0ABY9RAI3_9FLAO|nr:LamG-like jellyroll fold domain-containing protein [Flavobacterium sp. 20NA77.7]WMW77971.1 LamG-like jellyroll fold domain-containing protein [Flavobacterium sp. 20NA77.7]
MKNTFFSKILKQLLFISVLLTFGFSQGQTKRVLANWMGGNASSISFPYNGDYSNPITNGCSMNYSGITPQNDNRFFFTANPSSTLNTSTSPYISFTINAGSSSIDLDRIVFQSYAGASLNTSLRYSVDGYASNLGSITANGSSYSLTSVDLNSLANISGTVEFRMYFYGNASATSIMLGSTGSAYSSVDGTPSSYGPTPVAPPTGYSWSSVSFWYNYFAPVITTSSSLTTFSKCTGLASNAQTFSVSGTNLTSNITIAALTGYEYSLDGITYTSTLNISPSSGSVASTPVYVRLTTASTGSPSGNISISATGATTQTIAVTGVVNSLPTITIGSVSNVFQSATSFIIPYTATTNSPTLYSVSAGTNALSGFTPVSDVIFSGSSGNLTVPIPTNSALGTYDFVLKVKNATTLCESTLVNFTMKVATAPPTITSFSPISGAVGSTVTITGTGFNTTATNNIVSFDGVSATVTSATATSLNVTVPYGTTGFSKIKVLNTATGIAYSKGSFSTTFHNGGFGNGDYNYGTGTFNGAVTFTTAASWQTTADWKSINLLVDYNNDGFPDYTSMSNSSSSIYIYKNTITTPGTTVSTSTFSTTAVTLTATTTPSAIFSEDINGDGKMDLIVPTGSSIDIFINTSSAGTISFATKQTFTLACSNRVRFVDINKDGMLDIFSYSGAAFKYLLNTSTLGAATINFGTSISLTTATTPLDFDMADFNNDGYLDILFSYASGYYISLGSNTGFGVFTSNASSFSSGNIVSGDLDNDGDIDFVVKTSTSAINYFTNNGSGVFTSLSSSVGSPSGILNGFDLANFNGDAYPEVYSSNANSGPYIAIFNNTTTSNTLSYANSTNAYSSSNPMGLKATDVNGDGRPDIVAPGYYNTSYYVNQNIIGIPTISSFTPTSGSGGTSITITGTYFTGTTDVKFNGISATSFTVNSSTSITAIAPIGTTGTVQVITPGGTVTSASNFTYSPTIVRTGTLTAFSKCSGSVSAAQTFTVSGTNLTANLVVAAYTNLEYSLDGTTYSSTLSITPTSGTVATTTIYVRMTAASASLTTGNISITSTGATNQTIAVSGTVSIVTAISAHPSTASQSVCQGATLTALTVTASGTSLTYQWYSNTIASTTGSTLITGATSASYTPTNSVPSTFYYYCVVTGTCGTLTSNFSGLITINETPVAGTATISATNICPGNTVTLSLTGNTGSIQWQSSLNNSTWNNITGATTATYTTAALTTTTYYRAAITSGVCTVANSNVLTVTVPTAPYPFDRAVNFTSGGHLTKAAGTSINLTNWTVEAWIYPTAWNYLAGIVSKRDFQFMTNSNGALSVMIERDWSWELTTTANNVVILNKWQHVAASYNATSKVVKIYVNGVLVHTFTRGQSFVPDFNSYDFKVGYNNGIGNGTPNRTFAGNIDEVKVWNTVRTDAEVASNFATQLIGNESGLVAYYKFDQGVGGANNTAITSLIDATANGNHLTPASSSPVYAMTGATNNIVQAGPAILTSPNICLNATTTLTHTVSGGTWSTSNASIISIDSSTGAATANAEGSATITYSFTDNGCNYSSTKVFSVLGLPAITTQPAATAQNICLNGTATALSVTATGAGLTYQWYKNITASNTGGTSISGATSASYTPLSTTAGEAYYYCIVSGTCTPAVTSNVSGLIKVYAPSVAGTISSSVTSICDSGSTTLTLAGNTGTIQWQRFDNPVWTDLSGETNTTYTTPILTQNTVYRVVVTNGLCSSVTSSDFTVPVNTSPSAPTSTTTINYCQGATATALVATPISGYSLQWYTTATGGTASTTAPTPLTTSVGSTIYYVSQKQNSSTVTTTTSAGVTASYVSGLTFGQTFQVSTTSRINSLAIGQIFAYSPVINLKIYNGFGGALLGSADATMTGSGYFNPIFTFVNSNIVLNANQTYYFEVTSTNSVSIYLMSVKNNTTPTGVLYQNNVANSALDFDFTLTSTSIANPCESPRTAITVNVNEVPTISGIQNMTVGGSTITLTGSGTPDNTTPWTSSNTAVATITSSGVVNAVGGGTTTITYLTASGCSKTAMLRVVDCSQPFGNALAFGVGSTAATADFVNIPSRIFPTQSVANFTIETWIRPAASDIMSGTPGNSWLSFLGYTGTKRSPSIYITNNGVLHASWSEGSTLIGTPVSASSPTSLVANKWTHVALVKDGTTMRLFVDGIQIQSITCAANLDLPDNAYWLGKSDQQFSGALDEVRFWSTTRTQAQIQATMNAELAGTEAGLLAYFDFNEGIAGGTNTSITSIINKANNTLNGTLTNFTRTGTTSNFVGNSVSSSDITGAATICGNTTAQYTHQIPGGTWSVSNGATATISTSGLLTATTNENITLSYTYALNGCSFTATKTVAINSPAAPVTNTTINLCQGATTSALTATALSGHTLQWYTVATGGTASSTAPTPSVTTLGTTMYYVSQKNNTTNCESARTAITVTINAVPTISGAQSITVGGTPLQLTGSGTADTLTPWTSSNTAAATVSSTGVVTAVGAGSTIITYTAANGCTATAVISVVDCSQPFGNALQFDGVDDSFSTASNLSALNITGNITLETWIKFDQVHSDYVRVIGKGDNSNRTYGLWLGTNGKLLFQIWSSFGSGLGLESTTALQPGVWYHISATRSGNTAKIYINGIEDASTSTTVTPQTNTLPLTVGYGGIHTWLKGALDEVRVWNVARSLSQIQQGMYNALVGNETGLVAYYDFNQGIAGGNNSTINAALDRTTNVLHGTLTNFAKTGTASNFVGNTAANFVITGAATLCANSTSQYTHQVSGGTWSLSSGANATISTSGLLTAAANEDITVSYTYVVNGCTFIATKAVSIVTPAITVQPSTTSQNVCVNGITATLAVTATGLNNTYQWYKNTTASTTGGTLITGATNSVYMPSNTLVGTTYYYCVVSNTCSSPMTSNVSGAITISPVSVAGTITGTTSICSGATTTLTLSGNVGTIQWQRFDNPVWTDLTGETNTSFTTPVLTQNTTYRAVVISGYCSSAMTSSFNVVVNPLPVISGTTSVGTGESITLSATTTAASSNAWVSSNTVVATVSNMGVVTGLTTGTTTITYTNNNGCSDTEIITVTLGTTIAPVLTSPVTNTTGATTLNFNYTLPEPPLAGSVALIFTPTGGGTPILWTMTNATSATFSYVVGTNPTTLPNVVSGTALGFTTYDVTLIYQDAFSNPATSVTNTNIQTLAPPSISFANTNYTGIINQSIAIQTVNAGGGMVTYSISPILPTGLSLNTATGVISGTPTVTLAQTSFTVTATNAAGTDSESFNLFIDADTDGDGIGNATDTDIDGDGTANGQDTNPTNPCIGYNSSTASSTWQTADCDGDGILNGSDADVDGNGTIDNGTDIDGDGINDANDPDIDGDGIPNGADSDPDGNGTINNGPDTDGDGINDANDPDIDGDGIPNGADSDPDGNGTINNGPDTDGDGINDANDPDIDGDGIPNGADADANGDGTIDNGAVDTDGDGIVDGADSDVNGDGVIDNGPDTDGDGINDANDPDIDGDGIPNGADADPDGDGTINNGPDTDGDGINDANDPDIDGDGVPNGADADPDGNGTINNGPDTDGDGINDANDPDIDGDGIPNGADADPDGDGTINNGPDTDGDGINDAADADPDGNGTIDNGPDTDGDGINDANDPDIDGDGIPNAADVDPDGNGTNNNGTDMDGDGINDANDPDMDGDGIPNGVDNCPNIVNPSVITQPSSQVVNICPNGTPPTLTIQANGQQLEYQWYVNTINSNVGGTPITGATSTSFVPSNALVGPHYYYVVVNGTCGMSKSEVSGAITVQDITLPTVVTQNISVALNASGTATITAAQINNGSTDNCSIASVTVSPSSFTCANIGTNTVTLTVTDGNGNVNTGTATVTVTESTLPTVVTQNISVALNASGTATIAAAQINNGSTDNCSIASMTVSPSSFTCTNIGTNIVTLTVTDGNGNINTGTATVTVTDTILPTVVTQNASVTLNAQGTATVTATQVNNGSFDNCSIATITVSPSSFTCANIGTNTVTVTVTDASGNVSSSTAIVTVVLDNSISANNDLDAIPDNCDDDDDNDGILDVNDNCQFIANQDQLNTDNDTMGDICDPDDDNDGIDDVYDNCPKSYNPYQEDRDNDGQGDSCDTIEINVSDAISPNGDGINDTWVIYNIENHPNAVVKVFNRWGKEVFKARHYQNNWGGEFGTNTETLPEGGSYYYQIDLDGDGSIDKDGWLYISRK